MNYADFYKLIDGGIPCGAYILHGEEEYVKEQALQRIINSVEPDLKPFNVSNLIKPSIDRLYVECETLPFFTDKRIVVCKGLEDGVEGGKYVECFRGIAPQTLLLVVFRGKLAANLSILKFAVENGTEVLFEPLPVSDCVKWCMKRAVKAGVSIDSSTSRLVVQFVGTDMTALSGEMDKLIDYVGCGNAITLQAVSSCVKPALDVRIFDMLDMFNYGKTGDGMRALHALMEGGDDPMGIAAFLASRFKLMLEARRGIDAGKSKRDMALEMEGNRYANEKAYDAARRFTQQELMKLIAELSDAAYMRVTGNIKPEKYIEWVLIRHNWRTQPI